jgi:hypothetical protein
VKVVTYDPTIYPDQDRRVSQQNGWSATIDSSSSSRFTRRGVTIDVQLTREGMWWGRPGVAPESHLRALADVIQTKRPEFDSGSSSRFGSPP